MMDPTTNGYLVDEQGTILSLLEARERMADTRFVTYCKATSREKDLQKLYRKNIARTVYYAKNLFRIQVDAVSQFGESGNWLNFPPEHFFYPGMERCKCRIPVGDGACLRKGICGF